MEKTNILFLVPARFDSSRFPGKPLAQIKGKSLIRRVYERLARENNRHNTDVVVVTDHKGIEEEVKSFGGEVVVVEDYTDSGTERVNLAYERYFQGKGYDLVVNVQGDEPLIDLSDLNSLIEFHLKSNFDIGTMVRCHEGDFTGGENLVKVIFCPESGRCLYFSRSEIPYFRDKKDDVLSTWWSHVGVYSYRPSKLGDFCKFSPGRYEKAESLEQLRALENGLSIGAVEIKTNLVGVDTPEDIIKVEELINE